MRIARITKHTLYYLSIPIVVVLGLFCYALFSTLILEKDDLGAALLFIYVYLYAVLPFAVFLLMRFSMLRWYVDPFAAAEIPLTLLLMLFAGNLRKYASFSEALRRLISFCLQNWGWLLFIFLYALLCSFSLQRVRGRSLPGRIALRCRVFLRARRIRRAKRRGT